MGNRALIAFETTITTGLAKTPGGRARTRREVLPFGLYLHWNGGPESVWAFLDVLSERMVSRGNDIGYASARLVEIVGRYFGGNLSVGLSGLSSAEVILLSRRTGTVKDNAAIDAGISPGDSGVYVVAWDGARNRYCIAAHFEGDRGEARWRTAEELEHQEACARAHAYWTASPSIVEQVRAANAFPVADAVTTRASVAA